VDPATRGRSATYLNAEVGVEDAVDEVGDLFLPVVVVDNDAFPWQEELVVRPNEGAELAFAECP